MILRRIIRQRQAMAACGSLQHNTNIFEKPLPTLHEKDSSNYLYFGDETSSSSAPLSTSSSSSVSPSSVSSSYSSPFSAVSSSFPMDIVDPPPKSNKNIHRHSDSLFSMNSESLSMCTEGLGFESCEDINIINVNNIKDDDDDDMIKKNDHDHQVLMRKRNNIIRHKSNEYFFDSKHKHKHTLNSYVSDGFEPKISRITGEVIPPPISSIGRNGKPWVCFKSFRNNGRFVLKEVRIPTQELLHSCREDGRLKLQYIQSDEETMEEQEDCE